MCNPGLPRIMADRQRLRQIAVNLVSNGSDLPRGAGACEYYAAQWQQPQRVDVRDGVGIQAEAQRFIFTPFFRADNPLRDEVGGTGLGLSPRQAAGRATRGTISVDTSEGQGAAFSFALPLNAQEWTPVEWLERAEAPTT